MIRIGFKSWFKEGMKDAFKNQVELEFIAGQSYLHPKLGTYFKKTQMYEENDGVKIAVPDVENVYADILSVEWEKDHERSGGKAASGAIAGGMVGGVAGAAAGAAVGGRKKDTSQAVLTMRNKKDGEEFELHIKCDQDKYSKIVSFK